MATAAGKGVPGVRLLRYASPRARASPVLAIRRRAEQQPTFSSSLSSLSSPLSASSPRPLRLHAAPHHGLLQARQSATRRLPAHTSTRSFSAAWLIAVPVDAAEAAILQLHTVTHAPWFVVLPLVALGVNLLVRLPFSAHARRLAQRRTRLAPLLQAWAALHARAVHQEAKGAATAAATAPASSAPGSTAEKRYRRTARQVYRRFGLQQWKLYGSLAAMPPWLVVMEAIRRMCGAPVGLLGLVLWRGEANEQPAEATSTVAAAEAAEAQVSDVSAVSSAVDTLSVTSTTTDSLSSTLSSLSSGGCLWFPDLTAADPYHILPFALSAILIANLMPPTDAGRRALFGLPPRTASNDTTQLTTEGAIGRGFQRTLLLMSAGVGFATLHFPSAIQLYWLASATSSLAISRSLHAAMPLPQQDIRPSNKVDFPWIRPAAPEAEEKTVTKQN